MKLKKGEIISKSDRFLFPLSAFFFRAFRVFRSFPLRQFPFIKFPVETSYYGVSTLIGNR